MADRNPNLVDRLDIVCGDHNNVPLQSDGMPVILVPIDRYSTPPDYSLGWEFDFDSLSCPEDAEAECVDSWQALQVR